MSGNNTAYKRACDVLLEGIKTAHKILLDENSNNIAEGGSESVIIGDDSSKKDQPQKSKPDHESSVQNKGNDSAADMITTITRSEISENYRQSQAALEQRQPVALLVNRKRSHLATDNRVISSQPQRNYNESRLVTQDRSPWVPSTRYAASAPPQLPQNNFPSTIKRTCRRSSVTENQLNMASNNHSPLKSQNACAMENALQFVSNSERCQLLFKTYRNRYNFELENYSLANAQPFGQPLRSRLQYPSISQNVAMSQTYSIHQSRIQDQLASLAQNVCTTQQAHPRHESGVQDRYKFASVCYKVPLFQQTCPKHEFGTQDSNNLASSPQNLPMSQQAYPKHRTGVQNSYNLATGSQNVSTSKPTYPIHQFGVQDHYMLSVSQNVPISQQAYPVHESGVENHYNLPFISQNVSTMSQQVCPVHESGAGDHYNLPSVTQNIPIPQQARPVHVSLVEDRYNWPSVSQSGPMFQQAYPMHKSGVGDHYNLPSVTQNIPLSQQAHPIHVPLVEDRYNWPSVSQSGPISQQAYPVHKCGVGDHYNLPSVTQNVSMSQQTHSIHDPGEIEDHYSVPSVTQNVTMSQQTHPVNESGAEDKDLQIDESGAHAQSVSQSISMSQQTYPINEAESQDDYNFAALFQNIPTTQQICSINQFGSSLQIVTSIKTNKKKKLIKKQLKKENHGNDGD